MTDTEIRNFFELGKVVRDSLSDLIAQAETGEQWAEICRREAEICDLDKPRANLGFRSYREAATEAASKFPDVSNG